MRKWEPQYKLECQEVGQWYELLIPDGDRKRKIYSNLCRMYGTRNIAGWRVENDQLIYMQTSLSLVDKWRLATMKQIAPVFSALQKGITALKWTPPDPSEALRFISPFSTKKERLEHAIAYMQEDLKKEQS